MYLWIDLGDESSDEFASIVLLCEALMSLGGESWFDCARLKTEMLNDRLRVFKEENNLKMICKIVEKFFETLRVSVEK